MKQEIRLGDPVVIDDRVFLPLVRDEVACWSDGAVATRDPAALLICDDKKWFFAPLEPGITLDILKDFVPNACIPP